MANRKHPWKKKQKTPMESRKHSWKYNCNKPWVYTKKLYLTTFSFIILDFACAELMQSSLKPCPH